MLVEDLDGDARELGAGGGLEFVPLGGTDFLLKADILAHWEDSRCRLLLLDQ